MCFYNAGNAVTDRRWAGSSYSSMADQVSATGGDQRASNTYQHHRTSFSALPQDRENWHRQPRTTNSTNTYSMDPPSASFADHPGQLSNSVQRSPSALAHNLSITDADKLQQQQGQENVTGDYRVDRLPSRYSFDEMVVPDVQHAAHNPGGYPVERMPNFPPYFHGDSSSTSSSAYSRRPVSWSDDCRPQAQVLYFQQCRCFSLALHYCPCSSDGQCCCQVFFLR